MIEKPSTGINAQLVDALPRGLAGQVIGRQILRSATSVGANYRAACRAQSRADFAAKLAIVSEETDETLYWLEMLSDSALVKPERLVELAREGNELLAIITASRKTVRTSHAVTTRGNHQSSIINHQFVGGFGG